MRGIASIMDLLPFPTPHFWFPNRHFFTGWDCQPLTWRTKPYIYNPWTGWPSYIPRHWVTILVVFLRHARAPVGLFFNPGHLTGFSSNKYFYIYFIRKIISYLLWLLHTCYTCTYFGFSLSSSFSEPQPLDIWRVI